MTDQGRDLLSWLGDVCKVLGLEQRETLVIKLFVEGRTLLTSVFGNATIQRNWNRLVLDDELPFDKPILREGESVIVPDPKYGSLDADSAMVLKEWTENYEPQPPMGLSILEVGANEEDLASILAENGHRVLGVDLRPWNAKIKNYVRMEGDFVALAPYLDCRFNVAVSTSAIEHFGLNVYGSPVVEDYDAQAMNEIYRLLVPGGRCYLTVPYGREFKENGHWRVYCRKTLQDRLIGGFEVMKKIFFKSGGCVCPDVDGIVEEKDANEWSGDPPHVTVLLKLRKPSCG